MSADWDVEVTDLTADAVKAEAAAIGLDLCGIADADVVTEHPPPGDNDTTPDDLVSGAASIVVVADRRTYGTASIKDAEQTPGRRQADYANQYGIMRLEEKMLDLLYFLEDHGHPSLTVTPEVTRTRQYDALDDGPLSLPHVAVEAGLGTLGLNLQLLTPEFGPRVILGAVVTTADLEPDGRREQALCAGAKCGRCLLASPGDAVRHFDLDADAEREYTEPFGYDALLNHAEEAFRKETTEEREEYLLKNRDTMMLWQSMLRGAGVYTGSTRMEDVCPVGSDYERIAERQRDIPEATAEKRERLAELRRAERDGELPETYEAHRRWIGELDLDYSAVPADLTYDYLDHVAVD